MALHPKLGWEVKPATQKILAPFAEGRDVTGIPDRDLLEAIVLGSAAIGHTFSATGMCVGPKMLLDSAIAEGVRRWGIKDFPTGMVHV
jgi:hypothetical protein